MATNEEGEFELVLGNKQLLSVFFLVVLLLGVFFSMGYIVGRNTAPAGTQVAAVKQPPIVVGADPVGPAAAAAAGAAASLPDPTKPSPSAAKPDPIPPKAEPVKTEPAKPATAAKVEPPKPEPAKTAKAEPAKPEPPKPAPVAKVEPPKPAPAAAAGGTGAPVKGATYLQVAAAKPGDANIMRDALSKKGFMVATSQVPDSQLVRVLVGPLTAASVGTTKEALNAAGFKPIIRKF